MPVGLLEGATDGLGLSYIFDRAGERFQTRRRSFAISYIASLQVCEGSIFVAKDDKSFGKIFQLTQIARPCVAHAGPQKALADLSYWAGKALRVLTDEVS